MAGSRSTLPIPIPTTFNVSALAREYKISRTTVRRRLARGWVPTPSAPTNDAPLCPVPLASRERTLGAFVLVGIAVAIGALALAINGQTGWRFGTTTLASATFAGLALTGDLLVLVLPAAAVALWHARRRVLAVSAWTTWTLAAGLAAVASLGFVELYTSDTAAVRQAIIATSSSLGKQHEGRIAAAQLAVTAAAKAREAECAIRGPHCRDREGDERMALGALTKAIADPVPTVASIGVADPQVTATLRLATWAGMKLTTDDILNLRLILMAILPNVAGLLIAFAAGLARPLRPAAAGMRIGKRL
jgi:hypothetical protein